MKRTASILLLLLLSASGVWAQGEDRLIVVRSKPASVDVYQDLGCTRVVSGNSATWNTETSTSNTTKINNWLATLDAASAAPRTLVIPYGTVAINDTLGVAVTSGVSLPPNVSIIAGGGWANGTYTVNRTGYNAGASGFMWTGSTGKPMVCLQRWGNIIRCNWVGYPFVSGTHSDGSFPATRCASAIMMTDSFDFCGKHEISGTYTGFTRGIDIQAGPGDPHADASLFDFSIFKDCPTAFYCDNDQAVGHQFNKVIYHVPANTQSTVFDWQAGGNCTVDQCDIIGDYGVTVLNLDDVHENAGTFSIWGLFIDRAVVNATKLGNGYLRFVKGNSMRSFKVRIAGAVMWANEDLETDWINGDEEELVEFVSPTGGARVNINLDIWGAPDALNEAYPW